MVVLSVLGLGCRISSSRCDEHAMLDRDPSEWTFTVARQGPHADGCPSQRH